MKKKHFMQHYDFKSNGPSASWFGFLFFSNLVFLAFYSSVSFADEQLDPTDLLSDNPPSISSDIKPVATSFQVIDPEQKIQKQILISDNTAENFTAKVDKALPQNGFFLPLKNPDTQPRRLLWQAGIETIKDHSNKTRNDLQQIIEKIHSVEFKPKNKAPEPIIVIDSAPKPNDSNESQLRAEVYEEKIQFKSTADSITDETLKIVEDLSRNPEKIKNPFELGEILFYSGHLKQAGLCYQQALWQKDLEHDGSPQNLAWILFQIGNCLKKDDPQTAVKMYERLVKQYPESLWADIAKIQIDLINWHLHDKPKTLITKNLF